MRLADTFSTTFERSKTWAFHRWLLLSSSLHIYPSIFRRKRLILYFERALFGGWKGIQNTKYFRFGEKIRYTEIDIPHALAALSPSLAALSGSFRPDQMMCNWIAREMAKGSAKIPSYAPYLVPKLCSPPWMPGRADHSTSLEGWRKNSKQSKRKVMAPGALHSSVAYVPPAFPLRRRGM